MKSKFKNGFRLWAKALGAKSGSNDREANIIACLRTIPVILFIITDVLIIANIIHTWGCHP